MKNIRILFEKFQFLVVKFSIYLNRRVFFMSKHVKSRADDVLQRMRQRNSEWLTKNDATGG